jgi:hypothetical protein
MRYSKNIGWGMFFSLYIVVTTSKVSGIDFMQTDIMAPASLSTRKFG